MSVTILWNPSVRINVEPNVVSGGLRERVKCNTRDLSSIDNWEDKTARFMPRKTCYPGIVGSAGGLCLPRGPCGCVGWWSGWCEGLLGAQVVSIHWFVEQMIDPIHFVLELSTKHSGFLTAYLIFCNAQVPKTTPFV